MEPSRYTIDAYLSGMLREELEMLDSASKITADEIREMSEALDRTNKNSTKLVSAQ